MMRSPKGQALIEFTIVLPVLLFACVGAGAVLWAEWNRLKCAHDVFEKTHSTLVGENQLWDAFRFRRVLIQEDSAGVQGLATCGSSHEAVRFLKLESIQWEN